MWCLFVFVFFLFVKTSMFTVIIYSSNVLWNRFVQKYYYSAFFECQQHLANQLNYIPSDIPWITERRRKKRMNKKQKICKKTRSILCAQRKLKWRWNKNNTEHTQNLNVTVFYKDYNNKQQRTANKSPVNEIKNALSVCRISKQNSTTSFEAK